MTAEDVPNMVTPVAASLKEVIRSASSLRERLGAIADAAYSMVGEAADDAEERLEGEGVLEADQELPEVRSAYRLGVVPARRRIPTWGRPMAIMVVAPRCPLVTPPLAEDALEAAGQLVGLAYRPERPCEAACDSMSVAI